MQIDAPAKDGEANAALLDYISTVSFAFFAAYYLNLKHYFSFVVLEFSVLISSILLELRLIHCLYVLFEVLQSSIRCNCNCITERVRFNIGIPCEVPKIWNYFALFGVPNKLYSLLLVC